MKTIRTIIVIIKIYFVRIFGKKTECHYTTVTKYLLFNKGYLVPKSVYIFKIKIQFNYMIKSYIQHWLYCRKISINRLLIKLKLKSKW